MNYRSEILVRITVAALLSVTVTCITTETVYAVKVKADKATIAKLNQQIRLCNTGRSTITVEETKRAIAGCTYAINLPAYRAGTDDNGDPAISAPLIIRAKKYLVLNEIDLALADLARATSLGITSSKLRADALSARATALAGRGEFDAAITAIDEAIRISPKFGSHTQTRGWLFEQKGDLKEAAAAYARAIELDADLADPKIRLAAIAFGEGRKDAALDIINKAIDANPKNRPAYLSRYLVARAVLFQETGSLDLALRDIDAAIKVDLHAAHPHLVRGAIFRYMAKFDQSISNFDTAIRLEPRMASAYANRGMTYEKMGDLEKAKADFRKTLAFPRFEIASTNNAQEMARARLAALESGAPLPEIKPSPAKAQNLTSIPTAQISPSEMKAPAAPAESGRRVALIIGNSDYKNVPILANPQKDAELVAARLRGVGFASVTIAIDASREKVVEALRNFANEAEGAEWAMVYYAGHGIEVNGVNYLIPVDARLLADRDVQFEAVSLEQIVASVEGAKKLKLIVLDACRDNPFAPKMRRTVATRSIGRGLGRIEPEGATLVVYAAKHGQTALDGDGGNSPFAVALVQRLATPGVEINKIFRLIRDDVMEATAGRQEPFTYGSLPGREDFFFVGAR